MAISFMNSSMLNIGQSNLQIINKTKEQHIYGIKRLRTSSDSTWERTDDSIGLVANATHDGTTVQNDFDELYPWKDIISFDYDHSLEKATAYYGDDNFNFAPTDTNINVFTKIPKFWYKRWIDESNYENIQIATYAAEGFLESKEFAIGRYFLQGSTSAPRSISGLYPLVDTSGNSYRNSAQSMGNYTCLLDWQAWGAIQLLYLVEYADYDSQKILGNGICDTHVYQGLKSGELNTLGMKSGCVSNNLVHSVMYRGIEDIFGNVYQLIDGININNGQAYVCSDYTKYEFEKYDEDYIQVGYINSQSNGYITKLGLDENYPLLMLPIECSKTNSGTYGGDYYYYASGSMSYRTGGRFGKGYNCGIFCTECSASVSSSNSYYGTRLMMKKA